MNRCKLKLIVAGGLPGRWTSNVAENSNLLQPVVDCNCGERSYLLFVRWFNNCWHDDIIVISLLSDLL